MENQSLTDVTPAAGGRSVVEEEQQHHEGDDAGGGVHRVDDEHHDHAAHNPQQAGVPGEELESRSVGRRGRKQKVKQTVCITFTALENEKLLDNQITQRRGPVCEIQPVENSTF